jgi:nitric oxide synthase oxygenase domain/subunit
MNTKPGDLFLKAETFLNTCYHELEITDRLPSRLKEVKKEIAATGTYFKNCPGTHTWCAHGLEEQQPMYWPALLEDP